MKKSTKETLEVVGIIGAVALAARWLIHRHQNTAALAHINSPAGQHTTSDDVSEHLGPATAQMPSSQTATATMHAVTPPPLHRS